MAEVNEVRIESPVPSDLDLVERVTRRDKEALSLLYDRYARLVYSLSLRMVEKPGVAEEVAQDVFMALWQRGASYRSDRGPFSAWILSIAHNRCIDELRKRRRQARLLMLDIEEFTNTLATHYDQVANEVLAQLDRESILRALENLPRAQKEVIVMAYFQGLTQSEISAKMGAPLGTVKTRMRLGLQKMRELLVG